MSKDPTSYRFQIRAHTRHDDGRDEYGDVLWEESIMRVASAEDLPHRIRISGDVAERISRERQISVAVCTKSFDGAPFVPEYFVHHCGTACALWTPIAPTQPVPLGTSRHVYGATPDCVWCSKPIHETPVCFDKYDRPMHKDCGTAQAAEGERTPALPEAPAAVPLGFNVVLEETPAEELSRAHMRAFDIEYPYDERGDE